MATSTTAPSTTTPSTTTDRFATARAVADAVLYEGYVLYPYRASSSKNQLRWQFGVLAPPAVAADGSERSSLRTEVVVDAGGQASLTVRLRFLQVQRRTLQAWVARPPGDGEFVEADRLDVDGTHVTPWEEAVEHEIDLVPIELLPLLAGGGEPVSIETAIDLEAGDESTPVQSTAGSLVGRSVHRRGAVHGRVRVTVGWADGRAALVKVAVEVENTSVMAEVSARREEFMLYSFVAVHTLLAVDDGAFISLLDPPEFARDAVAGCRSEGSFPVLAGGADGAADVMLSSPIILYDNPAVAPESAGDFCDATEIDEILALRVLTLTDEEKAEARGTDPRAAAIIDRCDDMPQEMWARLHGAIRSLQPVDRTPTTGAVGEGTNGVGPGGVGEATGEPVPWWDPGSDASVDPWKDSIIIGGINVSAGTRVRLNPSRRADAQDLFYGGQLAIVKGVFRDVDGDKHVAVALENDPLAVELEWQGRFLYFHPDEVEVVR